MSLPKLRFASSLRTRLLLLATLACVGILLTALIGTLGMSALNARLQEATGAHLPAIRALEGLRSGLLRQRLLTLDTQNWAFELNATRRFQALEGVKRGLHDTMAQARSGYAEVSKGEVEQQAWQAFVTALDAWDKHEAKLQQLIEAAGRATAADQIGILVDMKNAIAAQTKPQEAAERALDAVIAAREQAANAAQRAAEHTASQVRSGSFGALVVLSALLAFAGHRVARSVSQPLETMRAALTRVADSGALTVRLNVQGEDELGQTQAACNRLLASLQKTLTEVRDGAAQVGDEAGAAAQAAAQVESSSAAQDQAAAAMAVAIQQMSETVSQVSEHAREVAQNAHQATREAQSGAEVIAEGAQGVLRMSEQVSEAGTAVAALQQQSREIVEIVGVIREIAERTNMLALNASIEAARAGEAGRGFAVVADEVRQLAEQTAGSTSRIGDTVQAMQTRIQAASACMQSAIGQVDNSRALAARAQARVGDIRNAAGIVAERMESIAGALNEQEHATRELASQVENVAHMTESNAASARSTAQVARRLDGLALQLRRAVERFSV